MQCFIHEEAQAVGTCAICGKGVCHACAVDHPDILGITCSEACSKELFEVREMTSRGKKVYGIGVPKKISMIVWMWLLFCVLFGGFGIFQYFRKGDADWFLILFSAACLFLAFFTWRRSKDTGIQY